MSEFEQLYRFIIVPTAAFVGTIITFIWFAYATGKNLKKLDELDKNKDKK